ncbi:unnamed protein product [Cuscuta campestris]|uniref:Rad60/SUMO-like domain-containing protein n=1 Tax=Cuscuta campestris TaxID=132261 RepID=A0A484KPX8_9ASTE|nr:unnamed protein product [Cuscuta campestris]
MDDSTDELDPLFDYRRVQPFNVVCLDDDSPDSSPVAGKKRPKVGSSANEKKPEDKDVIQLVDCEDKEDEEWLRPPPMTSSNAKAPCENSTIKEIRLKKKELASIAESAKEVIRDVEESVKKDLSNSTSLHSSEETVADQKKKPSSERAKIVICIQDKDGSKPYRVFKDDPFERVFQIYAEKARISLQNLIFRFDGDKISHTVTPNSLGMEDNDIVEVYVKPS